MKYKVRMLAFGKPGEVREVDLPVEPSDKVEVLLDQIFMYGQNDFQPQQHPSVSVGDVIELEIKGQREFYRVDVFGFQKMTNAQLIEYIKLDRRDRYFWEPGKSSEKSGSGE